jgi:cyclophilin family peptidyl-prolyl cis-trans isomerase
MNNAFFRQWTAPAAVALAILLFPSRSAAQYTNGLYAEFNTSMGSFTCALYYAQSPKAVANFIGLATDQRAWLELSSGVVRTNPFYNGTSFHRVVTNFVNQFGTRTGLGNDNPGYAFQDEFTNTLRFDRFGVLAAANSGPDSNGSQYFITLTNTPGLNDVHTIIGRLYGGSNVVYAINRVATVNEKPVTNVVINSINIQRIGASAIAFNIHAHGLPVVTNLNLTIARAGTNVSLTFSNRLYAENRLYGSSNLFDWAGGSLGMDNSLPLTNTNLQSADAPARFFRGAQIQYASSTGPPRQWFGKTLTVFFTSGASGTNQMIFNSSGGGTYIFNGSSGTILDYNWNQQPLPFRGSFVPIRYSGLLDTVLDLRWKSATNGVFTGFGFPFGYPIPFNLIGLSGTFTNSP